MESLRTDITAKKLALVSTTNIALIIVHDPIYIHIVLAFAFVIPSPNIFACAIIRDNGIICGRSAQRKKREVTRNVSQHLR